MAENNLVITLTLDDKASAEVASALKKVGNETSKVGAQGKESSKSLEDGFKSAGKEIKSFRQSLFVITGSIAALSGVVNAWANSNKATRDNLQSLEQSVTSIASSIGSLLGPTIKGLAEGLKALVEPIQFVVKGLQDLYRSFYGLVSFASQFSVSLVTSLQAGSKFTDAWSDSIKTANLNTQELMKSWDDTQKVTISATGAARAQLKNNADELDRLNVLFKVGLIDAQAYYDGINSGANNAISTNTIIQQQLQQLHDAQLTANNIQLQDATNKNQEYIGLLKFKQEEHRKANEGLMALTVQLGESIQTNLSGALTGLITGTMTAKQAFQQLGQQLIKTVVDYFTQRAVAMALDFAMTKGFIAANLATAVATGSAMTSAYAPAALAANIASFGGAALSAASTFPVAAGAEIAALASTKVGFAEGTDTVPAMLSPGEMVFPRSMADAIRAGEITVGGPGGNAGTGNGDIFITIQSVLINSKESIKEFAEELGFEIDRNLRNARARV